MNYLFMITEAVIPTLIASIYFYSGGKEWDDVFMLTLVLAPLGLFLSFFLPQSPQYLFDNNRTKEAEIALEQIAEKNN
jgi:hypothetical protein